MGDTLEKDLAVSSSEDEAKFSDQEDDDDDEECKYLTIIIKCSFPYSVQI